MPFPNADDEASKRTSESSWWIAEMRLISPPLSDEADGQEWLGRRRCLHGKVGPEASRRSAWLGGCVSPRLSGHPVCRKRDGGQGKPACLRLGLRKGLCRSTLEDVSRPWLKTDRVRQSVPPDRCRPVTLFLCDAAIPAVAASEVGPSPRPRSPRRSRHHFITSWSASRMFPALAAD